jgi:hypothetical protein
MIGPAAASSAVTVEAFHTNFTVAALAFSVLIGGVVLILEWDGARSPRDTFMAALGVPALLTGVLSSANLSGEAVRYAERVKTLNDERAKDEGIPVQDLQDVVSPTTSKWLPELRLIPSVSAYEGAVSQERTERRDSGLGIRFSEPRYWVVLYSGRTKSEAETELGSRYGALGVYQVEQQYVVSPVGGSLPYSEAISKAVELKRLGQGSLAPRLVKATE